MTSSIHVGTSGWSYDHWQHVLYPPDLPVRARLTSYVERFDTVELNASFYRWPQDRTFAGWRRRLPDGFRMSVKAPRGLTRAKQLYAPEVWVERIGRCWHELGDRRGVLLVQLPPAMARDDALSNARLPCVLRAPIWAGGPTGCGSGALTAMRSRPTSTTTATDTLYGTPRPYGRSWLVDAGVTVRPCRPRALSASVTGSGDQGVRARGSRRKASP
jgi:hypothetical protein